MITANLSPLPVFSNSRSHFGGTSFVVTVFSDCEVDFIAGVRSVEDIDFADGVMGLEEVEISSTRGLAGAVGFGDQ